MPNIDTKPTPFSPNSDTKSTSFETVLHLHELYCRVQRFRPTTLELYGWILKPFVKWLADEYGIETIQQVEAHHVQSYFIYKELQGASGNYLNTIGRELRAFFNYCVFDELIEQSPMRKIKLPRRPKKKPRAIPDEDIDKLLAAAATERDKALLLFMLDTGARAMECCNLNLGDINLRAGSAEIIAGKGEKDRTVYFGPKTTRALIKYIGNRTRAKQPVFLGEKTRKRLTSNGLRQLIYRISRAARVPRYSPHAFRRTFAIRCLRNGMNIYVVAQLMGHSDIGVLREYLEIVNEDLRVSTERYGVVDNL